MLELAGVWVHSSRTLSEEMQLSTTSVNTCNIS